MKFFDSAQRAVSLAVLLTIFIYLLLNVQKQRFDILYGLSIIAPPASISEYPDKMREAEAALGSYTYRREAFINLYSSIQRLLGKAENGGFDLVRSKDGSLNYGDFYHEIPRRLEEYALRVRRLKDYVSGSGCEVIFINTPPMHIEGYHTYSPGLPYQDESVFMDAMLFYLQGFGVDYIDMRTVLKNSGLEQKKYRYKTDAHWTIEASFEGFRSVVRMLESKHGESINPDGLYTSLDNYKSVLYPGGMAGSLAERTGLPFSEREDFTVLLPEFPTYFSVERDDGDTVKRVEGDFSAALIDGSYLSTDNLYMSYLGGLAPFRHIVNPNNPYGLRILFLCNSFSLPLAAFLSSAAGEIDMIYSLSQRVFGYSIDIDRHIAESAGNYDYIFVELDPGSFNEDGFSFFRA